jgi:hypothetical protein
MTSSKYSVPCAGGTLTGVSPPARAAPWDGWAGCGERLTGPDYTPGDAISVLLEGTKAGSLAVQELLP